MTLSPLLPCPRASQSFKIVAIFSAEWGSAVSVKYTAKSLANGTTATVNATGNNVASKASGAPFVALRWAAGP